MERFPTMMQALNLGLYTNSESSQVAHLTESMQSNGAQLIIGLNPGPLRVLFGAITSYSVLMVPLLSITGDMMLWNLFWFTVPLSILLTCGQQYCLNSETDEFSKRYLYFSRASPWKVLNKASAITSIKRHRSAGSDGGDALNSSIDFTFNDGTEYKWSMMYGPSEEYALEINMFLASFEKATDLVAHDAPLSGSSGEGEASPSVTPDSSVWKQLPPATKQAPAATSSTPNIWETSPVGSEEHQTNSTYIWDQ